MKLKTHTLTLLATISAAVLSVASAPEPSTNPVEGMDTSTLPLLSTRIVGQELQVIYNIPEGQHATVRKDFKFMTVQTAEVPGLEFGETIYPEGTKDTDGNTEYRGIVVLKQPIKILPEFDFRSRTVAVTAGYQLCLDSGVCMPPKKKTITLSFTLKNH